MKRPNVWVTVRTSPDVTSFKAWLENRNVTRSFSTSGTTRVAQLNLRPGLNHVYVSTQNANGRSDFDLARFVVLRRQFLGLVGVSPLQVGARSAPVKVTLSHSSGTHLRAKLNGKPVSGAFRHRRGTARLARLGAGDGVHFGRNRLKVTVFDEQGGYDVESQAFRISRRQALASAGHDRTATVGARVQLNGRASRLPRHGKRSYRWRIVGSPGPSSVRGVAGELKGASRARPILRPSQAGTYQVRLKFRGRGTPGASRDTVVVDTAPDDPPIGVPMRTIADGNGTISIDGQPVAGTGAGGNTLSYALLSRATRKPPGPPGCRSSIPFSGSVPYSTAGLQTLQKLVGDCLNPQYLLILNGVQGVDPAALGALSGLLSKIGGPQLSDLDKSTLTAGCAFSVIGVPDSPPDSAFANFNRHTEIDGCSTGDLSGFLQVNTATNQYGFAFSDFPSYDTLAAHTPSSNTIEVGDDTYEQEMPPDAPSGSAGFHIVIVDPVSLEVFRDELFDTPLNEVWPTNTGDSAQDQVFMQAFVERLQQDVIDRGGLLFMQSIGNPKPTGTAWNDLADALTRLGATRTVINQLDGSGGYTFIGGLGGRQAELSQPLTGDPARLTGVLARDSHAKFAAGIPDPLGQANQELPQVLYQAPQSFPAFDSQGEQHANAYIARTLFDPKVDPPDMRALYWKRFALGSSGWDNKRTTLLGIKPYPGTAKCGCTPAQWDDGQGGGVWPQIDREVNAVIDVMVWFERVQQTLDPSQTAFELGDIGAKIERQVTPPERDQMFPADQIVSWLVNKAIEYESEGEAPGVEAALNFVFGYISAHQTGGDGGALLGVIHAKASDLTARLVDGFAQAHSALNGMGLLIVSDYGKLTTVASKINQPDPKWALPKNVDSLRIPINKGAKAWFYSELMPVAWLTWRLPGVTNARDYNCKVPVQGVPSGRTVHPFAAGNGHPAEPDSGQYQAILGFDSGLQPIRAVRALGYRSTFDVASVGNGSANAPDAGLTDPLFKPDDSDFKTSRLGLYPQVFYERAFDRATATAAPGTFC